MTPATARGRFARGGNGDVCVPVSEVAGNAEVRGMCGGVTRHTLIAWRRGRGFPAPVVVLECGDIWDAREVRAWYQTHRG